MGELYRVLLPGYNQLQKILRHCALFWLKWSVHDLVLVISLHPLSKLKAIEDCMLKTWRNIFEWKGGGRSVSYVSQTCDQQRFEVRKVVCLRSVSIFLQLVVARSNRRNKTTKRNIEETKRRDEWQIETRKRRQRSEGTMGPSNEVTRRNGKI